MTITGITNASSINKFREVKKGLPSINRQQLQKICRLPIDKFSEYGKRYDPPGGRPYFYKDNGANILAIFHADYVDHVKPSHFTPASLAHDVRYFCPTLDDRAGGYAILHYLPQLGLNYDILITTGEEKLESTARWFSPPKGKRYHWMFQFDRVGEDVVMYQYYNHDSGILLKRHGWAYGAMESYSDICELEHLRCKGFNFGVGYHDQHTSNCYMSEKEFMWDIKRFLMFYHQNADKYLKHVPRYNIYLKDKGFGYFEEAGQAYRAVYQDTFTEHDIELIEQLEMSDYPFPENISKDSLEQIFREMRGVENNPDQLHLFDNVVKGVEATNKQRVCPACVGSGARSKGGPCIPCGGTGYLLAEGQIEDEIIPTLVTFNTGVFAKGRSLKESQELSERASEFVAVPSDVKDLVLAREQTKSAIIAHTAIKPLSKFKKQVVDVEYTEVITVDQDSIGRVDTVPQGRMERNGKAKEKYTYQKVGPGGSWVWCLEQQDGKAIRVDSIVQVDG